VSSGSGGAQLAPSAAFSMSPLEIIFSTLSVPERRVPQTVHSASYSSFGPTRTTSIVSSWHSGQGTGRYNICVPVASYFTAAGKP
jgi:hypothetical protein